MKIIINAKNALYALFIIEILRQVLFLIFSYSYSHITELITRATIACICLYLACIKNEYITTRKTKIALLYIALYNLLNKLILPISMISNKDYINNLTIEHINHMQSTTTILEGISITLLAIAFLTLIWEFQIKTSYKRWLTFLYFLPTINIGIWMLISPIIRRSANNDLTRIEYLLETIYIPSISGIITYSLMLWLIHNGHKTKNKIQ